MANIYINYLFYIFKVWMYICVCSMKSFQINILNLPYLLKKDKNFIDPSNLLWLSNSYCICEIHETMYIKYKSIIYNSYYCPTRHIQNIPYSRPRGFLDLNFYPRTVLYISVVYILSSSRMIFLLKAPKWMHEYNSFKIGHL